jgi:type VI secretion system protein ImpM
MATAGWFGKLPMLGDFAHRRLPCGFVDACDAWLSQGLRASRASLGPGWLDDYLAAPLWCFAWSPLVVDGRWWFGVLMPSVDAVGRYFPLVVAFDAAQAPTDAQALARWARWYDSAAACALQTLQDRATLDGFEAALAAAGTPSTTTPDDGAGPMEAAAVMPPLLAASPPGHATWWLQGGAAPSRVTVVRGLPAADRFAALLHGAL